MVKIKKKAVNCWTQLSKKALLKQPPLSLYQNDLSRLDVKYSDFFACCVVSVKNISILLYFFNIIYYLLFFYGCNNSRKRNKRIDTFHT
jgi:hypothetical protein